jgi:hypothetical protein
MNFYSPHAKKTDLNSQEYLIKSADSVFLECTIFLHKYGAHAAKKCAITNNFVLLWLIFLMKAIVLETEILPLSTGPPNNLQYGQSWQSFIFFLINFHSAVDASHENTGSQVS